LAELCLLLLLVERDTFAEDPRLVEELRTVEEPEFRLLLDRFTAGALDEEEDVLLVTLWLLLEGATAFLTVRLIVCTAEDDLLSVVLLVTLLPDAALFLILSGTETVARDAGEFTWLLLCTVTVERCSVLPVFLVIIALLLSR